MDPKSILGEDVEIEFNFLIIAQGRWKQKPIRKLAKHDLLPILSCRTRNSATQNPSTTASNLLFWWSQLASATATLSNFSFNFYSIIS